RMRSKGVSWHTGRVFFGADAVYAFDLLPEPGHRNPAFVNLQQYRAEEYLVDRAAELPAIDLRWGHAVTGCADVGGSLELTIETSAGAYILRAGRVVACDGSRSTLRRMLGLETHGRVFHDRFLIADVSFDAEP